MSEFFASHLSASHSEQLRRVVETDAEICLLSQRICLMVTAWQAICGLPSNKMGLEVRPEVRTISVFKENFFDGITYNLLSRALIFTAPEWFEESKLDTHTLTGN